MCRKASNEAEHKNIEKRGKVYMPKNISSCTPLRLIKTSGSSWFISRLYFEKINPMHLNWKCVKDINKRENAYIKTGPYQKLLVSHIVHNSSEKLSNNSLGLSAAEILAMAEELLRVM